MGFLSQWVLGLSCVLLPACADQVKERTGGPSDLRDAGAPPKDASQGDAEAGVQPTDSAVSVLRDAPNPIDVALARCGTGRVLPSTEVVMAGLRSPGVLHPTGRGLLYTESWTAPCYSFGCALTSSGTPLDGSFSLLPWTSAAPELFSVRMAEAFATDGDTLYYATNLQRFGTFISASAVSVVSLAEPPNLTWYYPLAEGALAPIALDATHVYFVQGNMGCAEPVIIPVGSWFTKTECNRWTTDGWVARVARDTFTDAATQEHLFPSAGARALAVDETRLFIVDHDSLWSMPKAGGPPTKLLQGHFDANLVLVGGALYVTEDAPGATNLEETPGYWMDAGYYRDAGSLGAGPVDAGSGDGSDAGSRHPRLLRIDPSTGAVTVIVERPTLGPAFAVDGADAFVTEQGDCGSVFRVPVSGGTPVEFAVDQPHVSSVAIHDGSVYWATAPAESLDSTGLGAIWKRPM
ncbi:MAG TPA: hypothetical protein VHE30_16660 [Polyangiaceae bacterium]|nr:hypothetical protein [Polyangiaceae bacterium]